MHACDIRQYLIRQNVFCTISPNVTLANIQYVYTLIIFSGTIIMNLIIYYISLWRIVNYIKIIL